MFHPFNINALFKRQMDSFEDELNRVVEKFGHRVTYSDAVNVIILKAEGKSRIWNTDKWRVYLQNSGRASRYK
jgi:hypothetical protein